MTNLWDGADFDTQNQAYEAALAMDRAEMAETGAPWPIVGECFSSRLPDHECPQCDETHDHQWKAWHDAPKAPGGTWSDVGDVTGPGIPVRCKVCGGRKCDRPACMRIRHHDSDHEEF